MGLRHNRAVKPVLWATGGLTLLVGPALAVAASNGPADSSPPNGAVQIPATTPTPSPEASPSTTNSIGASHSSQSSSNVSANVSQTSNQSAATNNSSASVIVNGQTYTAPPNSSINKTIVSDNGQTVTNVSLNHSQAGGTASSANSTVNINVSQNSSSGVP